MGDGLPVGKVSEGERMTHGKDCEEAWCSCNHPNLKVVIETEEYIYWEFTEA